MENRFLLLVVEAEEATRDLLTETLSTTYQVYTASDALEAADLLQREPFALLLVDLDLPILSGSELIRIIRAHSEYDQLPILALAADSPTFAQVDHQIQAALSKPFRLSELGKLVAATIQASVEAPSGESHADIKRSSNGFSPTPPWDIVRNTDGGTLEVRVLGAWKQDLMWRAEKSQRRAQALMRSIGEAYDTQCQLIAESKSLVQTGHTLIRARTQSPL